MVGSQVSMDNPQMGATVKERSPILELEEEA
jgi:hypothetical protein